MTLAVSSLTVFTVTSVDRPGVPDIADDELGTGIDLGAGAVHRRQQRVEDPDLVPAVQQEADLVRPDEPAATGHQDPHSSRLCGRSGYGYCPSSRGQHDRTAPATTADAACTEEEMQ